jgi:NTE family protein
VTDSTEQTVAVVLTGAAARGAFQAGVLAAVIPALEGRGLRPTVFLGTSAGAINAALWGSYAHLPTAQAVDRLLGLWRSMDRPGVLGNPAVSLVRDALRLLPGALLGVGPGLPSLLDTAPLAATARRTLDEDQLAANVRDGYVHAVGVAATRVPPEEGNRWHVADAHSVLFLDSTLDTSAVEDPARALRMAAGPVSVEQVLASAAIPVAFPAVRVPSPTQYEGWYVDGGVRLNAPLRPAVSLGADRVVLIAAHATAYPGDPITTPGKRPDAADAAAMTLHSVLADRVIEDLQDLRTRNDWVRQGVAPPRSGGGEYRDVQVLDVAPQPGELAALAAEVLSGKSRRWWRELDSLALGRLLRGVGDGPGRQELLSYTFFDDEYFARQIDVGRRAAEDALVAGWS